MLKDIQKHRLVSSATPFRTDGPRPLPGAPQRRTRNTKSPLPIKNRTKSALLCARDHYPVFRMKVRRDFGIVNVWNNQQGNSNEACGVARSWALLVEYVTIEFLGTLRTDPVGQLWGTGFDQIFLDWQPLAVVRSVLFAV